MRTNVGKPRVLDLTQGIISGHVQRVQTALDALVKGILSYYDTADPEPERIYHVFVLGLLSHLKTSYRIRSNREAGYGRYDCAMIPKPGTQTPGILIEFKTFQGNDPQAALKAAHDQIKTRDHAADLRESVLSSWYEFAIAFNGKRAHVSMKSAL